MGRSKECDLLQFLNGCCCYYYYYYYYYYGDDDDDDNDDDDDDDDDDSENMWMPYGSLYSQPGVFNVTQKAQG